MPCRPGPAGPALALLLASSTALGGGASAAADWRTRGEGLEARAVWQAPDGDPTVSLDCEQGEPRVRLRVASARLPVRVKHVRIAADGVAMDYPVEAAGAGAVVARIALDAPLLDRMLVAQALTVGIGGRLLQTGLPGAPFHRVVRTCRDLHWPRDARAPSREARIEPSEAGLAKK